MNNAATSAKEPKNYITFFVLTFILSVPFYIGGNLVPPEMAIVSTLLITFIPIIAALILTIRENGSGGAKALLKRSFDFKKITKKIWYVPIIFLMPIVYLLVLWILGLIGETLTGPLVPLGAAPILLLVFFIMALGEEVGWMGYAYDPMEERWNTFKASLILGIIHAAWHIPLYIYVMRQPLLWMVGQLLVLAGLRILQVWIYKNTGKSLFAAILFHAVYNVPTIALPVYGSPLGPVITAVFVIIFVVIVSMLWDHKTMTHFRNKDDIV
jgi:membrane protease YdiL (CAAX protease family)